MKPAALGLGALAITLAGTGGYLLGRSDATGRPQLAPAEATATATTVHPAARPRSQRELTPAALADLRAKLNGDADPLARFKLALEHLEAWVAADPAGALAWLDSQQQSARRNEVIQAALAQYAESDAKGAAQWALDHLTGVERHNTLIELTAQWARQNGGEAIAWLQTQPASKERDAAMEGSMFLWAADAPPAALEFIAQHPDERSATLRCAAFAGWAKSNPAEAVAASLASSRTVQDPAQFANTLANWATVDVAASAQWLLANVTDPAEREPAVRELATIFANQSPAAGLNWCQQLQAGPERNAALSNLAAEWATTDPAAAAQWAATQAAGILSDDSLGQILHNFLAGNTPAFETWRKTLPDSPLKDRATKLAAMTGED